ncbi:MAG: AMP-binding protein [Actinobacteria bacterium]|nr:AMP-binding protein [Actinomycetota bacterium]
MTRQGATADRAGDSAPSRDAATLPKLLAAAADRYGDDRVALQEKHYGIWQPIGWTEYQARVRNFAHGLAALGVEPGEIVAVLGDNRPEWLIAELAAQSIGAAVVGIYPTSVGDEIVHILTQAQTQIVVAEDQEQVDKLLGLRGRVPELTTIVYYDPHGLEAYSEPELELFTDVEARGREHAQARQGWLDEQIAAGRPDDVAVICTTSGTTSRPKLAMLSHRNLLAMGQRLMELDPIDTDARYVSFLPFAWIGEQMLSVACGLQAAFTVSFPEETATVKTDMREIGPDVMFGPPRIWESMIAQVQVRLGEAGWLKRAVFGWGYRVGDRVAGKRVTGAPLGGVERALHLVADAVALRPMREQLGLTRIRRCYTGGAPLGPDVFRFFHAIGVNLKQIYGQTEVCGIAVCHADDDIKFNTVGRPLPGTDLDIADDGDILLRSDAVFSGYYRNEDATAEALDPDGWLHTGDAGYVDDDGHLVVIDRAKDVMRTPGGTMFSPAFLENKLKFSPYVEEAVVFGGEGREDITAMITIDQDTVGTWAERNQLSYTTYTDLSQRPQVYELIAQAVQRANDDLEEEVRISRFVLLHKQLDPDDEEITRTRKVRRGTINERYERIITALDEARDSVTITSTVTYQDGTTVDREIELTIFEMTRFTPPPDADRPLAWSTA